MHTEFLNRPRVAYFSMEVALDSNSPTYAGGLGVLAGDVVRSAADLNLPLVAVTLVSRHGYFHQTIDPAGQQQEQPDTWAPQAVGVRLGACVAVTLEGRDVWIGAWLVVHQSPFGGRTPVLLLDTDLPANAAQDRRITDDLYGGDARYRLAQQAVLGIGGVLMLRALGFRVGAYHLNEGHAALLTLQLMRHHAVPEPERRPGEPPYDLARVRSLCIFTTHTPVESATARYDYALWSRMFADFIDVDTLKHVAGSTELNMTRLAASMSAWINGVAQRHAETASALYPGRQLRAVTNGVHAATWTCASVARLYDTYLGHWREEPALLSRVPYLVPEQALWSAHVEAKSQLCAHVQARCGVELRPQLPLLGFARRMTAYKRPHLLFEDLDRLRAIAARFPFQLVYGGKAHPADLEGKRLIGEVNQALTQLRRDIPNAFIGNYGVEDARFVVAGVDVWLNTPLPPMEASGTSGMKAALNGVPSLSVLDGWWVEGCIEGVTGWGLSDAATDTAGAARACYDKLELTVLPAWYGPRSGWLRLMSGAIGLNGATFHSHRMMRRYASEAYLR